MRAVAVAGAIVASIGGAAVPHPALGFERFTSLEAEATFGEGVTFSVDLVGDAPAELELLLQFGRDEVVFVQRIEPDGQTAEFVWDTEEEYIAPNTRITYRWRASEPDGEPMLSRAETILYDDDRSTLDWEVLDVGQARVHWYGNEDAIAQRLGQRTSDAIGRSEELFGAELGEQVDIFLYRTREEFFGAIEPRAREWVGGEARAEIRTVYAWLGSGGESFLEELLFHEVAHMVFADATDNPYHEPARWVDEGLATLIEPDGIELERSVVEGAASDGRLVAFEAIAEQFPAGRAEAELAYAQSATLMHDIIDEYGPESIARMTAAYREGATEAEAVEAATDTPLDEVIGGWFARYGHEVPEPIAPEPLIPAEGGLPAGVVDTPGPQASGDNGAPSNGSGSPRAPGDQAAPGWLLPVAIAGIVAALVLGGVALRRATARPPGNGDG